MHVHASIHYNFLMSRPELYCELALFVAYATLLHFMTQLSRRSLSSLGGAPFVWQVRFKIFLFFLAMCVFWKVILVML